LQRIRTAPRTSGGRFGQGERVDARDRSVEGSANVRGDQLHRDRAEDVPENLSGAGCSLLEDVLQLAHTLWSSMLSGRWFSEL
jgi:hypothetical protein